MKYISSLSVSSGVVVKQVFFEAEKPKVMEGFRNNAVYGILLGRVHIFGSPLQVINGSLDTSLREFVLKICPLPSRVAFVNEGNLSIVSIHDFNLHGLEVTYYGNKVSC